MNRKHLMLVFRLVGCVVLAVTIGSLVGCGAKGTLSGKVTFQGNPMPVGTRVVFLHESSERSFQTEVKAEDGSYVMEGLPTGKMLIAVQPSGTANVGAGAGGMPSRGNVAGLKDKSTIGPSKGSTDVIAPPPGFESAFSPQKGGGPGTKSLLPRELQDPKTSQKFVEVKGGKQPFDITLD